MAEPASAGNRNGSPAWRRISHVRAANLDEVGGLKFPSRVAATVDNISNLQRLDKPRWNGRCFHPGPLSLTSLRWAGSASGLVGDKRLAKLYRYKGLECGQGRPAVRPLLARSKLGDVRRRLRPGPGCPANRGRSEEH